MREFTESAQLDSVASLFETLSRRWQDPIRRSSAFVHHGETCNRLLSELRQDESLSFLDAELLTDWSKFASKARKVPRTADGSLTSTEIRSGYYFCLTLIQLMENVYLDLDLETNHGDPDNRGWMKMFRNFSRSEMFRSTWSASVGTFGARFQTFCERRLGLDDIESISASEDERPQSSRPERGAESAAQ